MARRRSRVSAAASLGPLAGILERERREQQREGPPRERKQHDPVARDSEQMVDAHGNPGAPWRTPTLLERLEGQREITRRERAAGEEFQRLFRIAELDELRASDPARVVVSGGDINVTTARSEHARGRIRDAVAAVGGQNSAAGLVCWYVLGLELSLREFEQREGWSPRRPLSREASKGALVGALGVLEKFFGMT